jgi:hypothetical protein
MPPLDAVVGELNLAKDPPLSLIDSIDAADYFLGLSQRRIRDRRNFQFPVTALDLERIPEFSACQPSARLNTCRSGTVVKAFPFLSLNSFITQR